MLIYILTLACVSMSPLGGTFRILACRVDERLYGHIKSLSHCYGRHMCLESCKRYSSVLGLSLLFLPVLARNVLLCTSIIHSRKLIGVRYSGYMENIEVAFQTKIKINVGYCITPRTEYRLESSGKSYHIATITKYKLFSRSMYEE